MSAPLSDANDAHPPRQQSELSSSPSSQPKLKNNFGNLNFGHHALGNVVGDNNSVNNSWTLLDSAGAAVIGASALAGFVLFLTHRLPKRLKELGAEMIKKLCGLAMNSETEQQFFDELKMCDFEQIDQSEKNALFEGIVKGKVQKSTLNGLFDIVPYSNAFDHTSILSIAIEFSNMDVIETVLVRINTILEQNERKNVSNGNNVEKNNNKAQNNGNNHAAQPFPPPLLFPTAQISNLFQLFFHNGSISTPFRHVVQRTLTAEGVSFAFQFIDLLQNLSKKNLTFSHLLTHLGTIPDTLELITQNPGLDFFMDSLVLYTPRKTFIWGSNPRKMLSNSFQRFLTSDNTHLTILTQLRPDVNISHVLNTPSSDSNLTLLEEVLTNSLKPCPENSSYRKKTLKIVKELLKAGIGGNFGDSHEAKLNALHFAVMTNHFDTFELIVENPSVKPYLDNMINSRAYEIDNDTPLEFALKHNIDEGIVQFLEKIPKTDKNSTRKSLENWYMEKYHEQKENLGLSQHLGFYRVREWLDNHGFVLHKWLATYTQKYEENPLFEVLAVIRQSPDQIAQRLLSTISMTISFRPELMCRTDDKFNTVFHAAAKCKNVQVLKLLISLFKEHNDREGHVPNKILVNLKSFVNTRNSTGKTAVHYAIKASSLESVKLLVDIGAKMSIVSNLGNSGLHMALSSHRTGSDVIKYLLSTNFRIDPDKKETFRFSNNDVNGMKVTPYYLACQHHSKEIVNLLTENANLISAKYGQNAFFFVSKNTQHGAEIIETLDSSDINQKDLDGNTALYYACTEGSVDIAKALILKGADPTLELTEHCPLFLAAIDSKSANSASLIEFLIDYSSEDGKKIDLLYTIRLTQQHYLNSICGHLYPLSVVKKLHQAMLEQYRQKHGDFEKDPFIFHKNATGSYPLRHAVMSSSFEVVEYFLNLTGINSQMDGQNLLIAAANRDASTRADMLQYFIEMKHPYLNPLLIDPGSGKSLLLFVESDFKSVKYLLEKGKELFSTCSSRLIQYVPDDSISEEYAEVDFSATASPEGPYSSSDDDPPTSSVLPSQIVPVVNPLDINFSDNIGRTLLGHLLSSSLTKTFDLELVRYIISQDNFNINHVDKYERTYIDLLALNWLVGGFEVLKLLLEKGLKTNYRFPPLNYIASHGDIKAIELLIQHNANVNLLSASGSYPIHAAKNLMVVQQLVSHGADITAKTTNGETLLHFAAHRNLPDIVDYLCNYKNFNVNELDNAGKGAIHYAAEYGHVNVLRVLLQKSPSEKVDLVDCDQRTALMIAIENSHKDAILCLIDSNATLTNCLSLISNLESTDFVDFLIQKLAPHHHNDEFYDLNQFLLLHNTAKCGNFSLLSHLLKTYPTRLDRYHIDPKSGNTPLHCAMVGRLGPVNEYAPIRPNLGPIMMPSIKPQHSLAISDNDSSIPDVQYDPIELLKLLTNSSNGAERGHTSTQLSLENAEGLTPLGIALKNGLSIDIVKFLVENGAQIRQSEFLLGVAGSSTEVLKYLILGVKVNAIRTSVDVQTGNTALHIAAWNYCHEFEPLVDLVYHKDTINKPNKDGKTPLHQASHLNKVKYLIQKGANKNEQDGEGRTVLFSPVFAALPQVHEYNTLVNEYGIDPQICDNDGNTILHKITSSSSRYLDPDVIEYFINVFKLDFFQQNNSGQTPYSLALNNSHNSKTIQELLTRYTPPI